MRRGRLSHWLVHLIFIGLPALLALGGYLFSLKHAHIEVALQDVGAPGRKFPLGVPITFNDAQGNKVLEGVTTAYGTVALQYPEFGDCAREGATDEERWRDCRYQRARWASDAVSQLASLSLALRDCRMRNIPLSFTPQRDVALTWWLPIQGVGGVPLTYYRAELQLDLSACQVVGAGENFELRDALRAR